MLTFYKMIARSTTRIICSVLILVKFHFTYIHLCLVLYSFISLQFLCPPSTLNASNTTKIPSIAHYPPPTSLTPDDCSSVLHSGTVPSKKCYVMESEITRSHWKRSDK